MLDTMPVAVARDAQSTLPKREPALPLPLALLTGGGDRPYAFGLATAVASRGIAIDFIGSDELDMPELKRQPNLRFLNLRGGQDAAAGVLTKIRRIALYYVRLIRYAATSRPRVFHILWNNKFQTIDRTALMLYYKLLGKKVVFTAHNVNIRKRDGNDTAFNRLTLRIQYHLADHIFVHTDLMKAELVDDFGVPDGDVTVIPIGFNNSVPNTALTSIQAKRRLRITDDKTILFFGHIGQYKGLDLLVEAFQRLVGRHPDYRLLIVGKPKLGAEAYFAGIQRAIERDGRDRILQKIEFVPDEETELYFKAADVLVLPYTQVSQSGVLVLGHTFGLPVIATDVGSLREDIIEGVNGFVCRPNDTDDLAAAIEGYFDGELFANLEQRRNDIRSLARRRYSWDAIGETVVAVYRSLLERR
jgi:glycosyltransferase involved in cell wall biosynthesis